MSYCTKCGSQIKEGEQTCQTCGYTQPAETVSLSKPEVEQNPGIDDSPVNQEPITHLETIANGSNGNNLSNGWKVFLTALTVLVPLIGPVLGLIMSLIYLASPNMDSKSYGKALLILTIVYIGIGVVCCLGFMFLSMAGMIADPEYYYNQFDVY